MDRSRRRTPVIAILTMATFVWACGGATVSVRPSQVSAEVTPSADTPAATATVRPVPSASTTPAVPSPSPMSRPLIVTWARGDVRGLDGVHSIAASATNGTEMLIVGRTAKDDGYGGGSGIWRSIDGRTWGRVLSLDGEARVSDITAGGPGFVAVGTDGVRALVWTSTDGRRWRRVKDAAFDKASMRTVIATRSGAVAFGHSWMTDSLFIWTSKDGTEWLRATNETGLQVARGLQAVASYEGRALAFVTTGSDGPVDVWETTGRAEWHMTGRLPEPVAGIQRAVGGPRGWVALGDGAAWFSRDGLDWRRSTTGPDVALALVADGSGFIASGFVGSFADETCGDQRPFHGFTWTSSDGQTWQRMGPTAEFETSFVAALFVRNRTLIGVGSRYPTDLFESKGVATRWTASLPAIAGSSSRSDRPSAPRGCGT